MNALLDKKIAFVGWNPFQFTHFQPLAKAIPNACFVVEVRQDNLKEFDDDFFTIKNEIPVVLWNRKDMSKLDKVFDVIVAQTQFMHIHMLEKAKLVFLQYGYAKEPHNYGAWRALADLTLTYGDYATDKISHFCHSVSTGNPRYAAFSSSSKSREAIENHLNKYDPTKPNILYLPTWGGLSSVDEYTKALIELTSDFNVIAKLHHNTLILEKQRCIELKNSKISMVDLEIDTLDLIDFADVVISDYSGAIFDAAFLKKKIVLLNIADEKLEEETKLDIHSLEYSHRSQLGYEVKNPFHLARTIKEAIAQDISMPQSLYDRLFYPAGNAIENCVAEIGKLVEGQISKSQQQAYISHEVKETLAVKRELAIIKMKTQK